MPNKSALTSKEIDPKPYKISKKTSAQSEKYLNNGDERFHMISEAAYYRALERGFDGGDPVEDWLMAEAEFDMMSRRLDS